MADERARRIKTKNRKNGKDDFLSEKTSFLFQTKMSLFFSLKLRMPGSCFYISFGMTVERYTYSNVSLFKRESQRVQNVECKTLGVEKFSLLIY